MSIFQQYYSYFLQKAIADTDLQHDESAGNVTFEYVSVEEHDGDFRGLTREKDCFMRLLEPSTQYLDTGTPTILVKGAYMISCYYSPREGDKQAYLAALDRAYNIGHRILKQIIQDSENGEPFLNYACSNYAQMGVKTQVVKKTTGDMSYVGILFFLDIRTSENYCPS